MGVGPVCWTSLSTGFSEWELGPCLAECSPILFFALLSLILLLLGGLLVFILFFFGGVLFCSVNTCRTVYKLPLALSLSASQLEGRSHQQNGQQQPRPKYNRRAHITHTKDIPRASSSGDQGDCISWVPQDSYHIRPPHKDRESKCTYLIHRNKRDS